MARKSTKVRTIRFADLKSGERFQFEGRREGAAGRKPIFVKEGQRGYRTRLGEKIATRQLSASVRKVAR